MGVLAPSNVTAVTVSGSSILVEWENNDEYDNIDLYRNVDGGEYVYRMDFDGTVESFLDTGLEKEKAYCYKLRGIVFTEEDEETSDWSDPPACSTTFADVEAPTDLVATPISDTKVDLTFKVNSLIEDSVRIERKPDGGEYKEIAILAPRRDFFRDQGQTLTLLADGYVNCVAGDIGKQVKDDAVEVGVLLAYDNTNRIWSVYSTAIIADASAITITGGTGEGTADEASAPLIKDQKYYWQVRVRKDDPLENSDYCDAAFATTIDNPGIPTLAAILAADTEDTSIRIRWSDVANETGYRIEMSKTGDLPFDADEADLIAVVGVGVTDFLATGLDVGTAYSFRVRAYNAAGNGTFSDTKAATTDAVYKPTEFEKWIRDPNIEPVYLAEIYTKMDLTGFTLESGVTWKKTIGASDRGIDILEVFEDSELYIKKTSIETVEATASTFWFDYDNRILYVHTSDDTDPANFLIEGAFWLYFSTHKDIEFTVASGRLHHFLPLLAKEDIPDITQEIKPYFEGSFSISSGSIAFKNALIGGEHFFDEKFATYTWINAKVILKAGRDDFTYAQFKEIFTALINEKSCTDKKITFQLRDIREDMKNKITLNTFDVTNYPDVEDEFRDKPRPIYFGTQNLITPVCVDAINERFKCNDGRIKAIDAVYRNGLSLVENKHYYIDLQRARITFDRAGAFTITAGVNDKIDFEEIGNGQINVTLDPGTYTTLELCAEIKAKMEAGNGHTYTVTVDSTTKKFTIAADARFELLWKTGTNGSDGTDTHVGATIGFADEEDSEQAVSHEADEDVISIRNEDIIGVQLRGIVNSADEVISNGAEVFKYLMNTYKSLSNTELNLDSIYEAKYANEKKLAVPIESEISFDEIVRSIEHSIEAYTFQDEFGRLGIRPQQTTVASNAKYVVSSHIFGHSQKKDKSSLFWKVNVYYNKDYDDNWEVKTATDNEIYWKYGVIEELPIYTYFRDGVNAQSLATSILSLLNKEQIGSELPMLLFDVMPGDLIKFSRTRFYDSDGTASEITLRINRISKSPGSGRTSITAGVV